VALGAGFIASKLLPTTFTTLALGFLLTGNGFALPLSEQFLLEQRPSMINEPHSQNSANIITPFLYKTFKLFLNA